MINMIISFLLGSVLTLIITLKIVKGSHDYSNLIKRCIDEANKDLSHLGKKNIQIRVEKLMNLSDRNFKLHTGLKKKIFLEILEYLTQEFDKAHEKGSNKGIGIAC